VPKQAANHKINLGFIPVANETFILNRLGDPTYQFSDISKDAPHTTNMKPVVQKVQSFTVGGWRVLGNSWYWFGESTLCEFEDYKFGYYDVQSAIRDERLFHNPKHIQISAANNSIPLHPENGKNHFALKNGIWVNANTDRPSNGSGLYPGDGYDAICGLPLAKNIITIGSAYESTGRVRNGSAMGPADDGRIKPDIIAKGILAENSDQKKPTAIDNAQLILERLWRLSKSELDRELNSASMKALVVSNAIKYNDGPTYSAGWGLLDEESCEDFIVQPQTQSHFVDERVLKNGEIESINIQKELGKESIVTIVWLDPEGEVHPACVDCDNPSLINDLDLRVQSESGKIYLPFKLNPKNPLASAVQGDNSVDNIEQIRIPKNQTGEFKIFISHKRELKNGSQSYSILVK